MKSKYWYITIDKKEYMVKATASSAAIKKAMLAWRKKRNDREMNWGDSTVNITIVKSNYRAAIEWQKEKKTNQILI